MTPIPESWRGPFAPRDPLREQRPRNPFPDPPENIDRPFEETSRRVEQERDRFQEALSRLGGRLRRRAQ